MRYLIERVSRVGFPAPVREHHRELRVAPWDDELQELVSCSLLTEPPGQVASHRDGFGNRVERIGILGPHEVLTLHVRAEVRTRLVNPFDYSPIPPDREPDWIAHGLRGAPRLCDFVLHRSPRTPDVDQVVAMRPDVPAYRSGVPLLAQVQGALGWVARLIDVDPDCPDPEAQLGRVLERRCGCAADLAHLLITVVRGWGVPARYVSGFLDPAYFEPDEDEEDAAARPQVRHAWAEVLIPGAGWRGFDPAFELLADQTYVRVAVGRDAGDVPAERAAFKGGTDEAPSHSVTLHVTRLESQ